MLVLKEILYTTAIDQSGNIVHIDDAERGHTYCCPICKREFILRRSGKTVKGSRRPHFAHNELAPNCTPESVLHYSFKKLLVAVLKAHQSANIPFPISWGCTKCKNRYTGNLLESATSIREEYVIGECRPDVALLNEEDAVVAVIEIVVSHTPEASAVQYYLENRIVLIQIALSSEHDLVNLKHRAANPDVVELCLDAKCPNYEIGKIKRELIVRRKKCGVCFRMMNASMVRTSHAFGVRDSTDFNDEEVKLAESMGVRFERRFKQTSNEPYHAVVCINCKMLRSRYGSPRL
jgi:Competence protein CoiA-like family